MTINHLTVAASALLLAVASPSPPSRRLQSRRASASAAPRRPRRSKRSTSTSHPSGVGLPDGRGTVAEGAATYAAKCASCHGPNGEDGKFDRLVGRDSGENFAFARDAKLVRTIGNYWPYASTLFDYTARSMPFPQPGTLSANEVYGLVAYLLSLNKIVPETAVMDKTTLPKS